MATAELIFAADDRDFVDDLYFSAVFGDEGEEMEEKGEEEVFQVSDEKYAEGLQFQEALMGSIIVSQMNNNISPPLRSSSSSLMVTKSTPLSFLEKPGSMRIIKSGESSLSFCEICVERKENDQMFKSEGCIHSFCSDCITKHVAIKVQDSSSVVTCPAFNCSAVLELDTCRPILSKGVIQLWEKALCAEMVASQSFYCPFKECSALLVDDNEGGEAVTQSECPFCHRLFCAQCYVPWHSGLECEEFQKLNEDERGREDLLVKKLAEDQKWSRCPQCKYYVERTEGCPHMICRCRFEFCYGCGEPWTIAHSGCKRN